MIVKENIKNVKEFNSLYDNVGWGSYDERISKVALDNTFYSVSIYENDEIIGFGRIIGDTITFLYIHDVMVRNDYQGHNVGSKIMDLLIAKINEIKKENPDLRVYLGASKGCEGFYRKFGFISRNEADLGDGMILKKEN